MPLETTALEREVNELETLLLQVKTDGNVRDLQALLQHKKQTLLALQTEAKSSSSEVQDDRVAAAASDDVVVEEVPRVVPGVAPVQVKPSAHSEDDTLLFKEISRFGWEDEGYGKNKVMVYIMSGVDGVGDLPKENVACKFTKDSFDLTIRGLHGTNYRLVKHNLDKEIDPSKSTYRVKKNRVQLSLWKKDKNNTWMNLTAKNPLKPKAAGAAEKDPTAGIMDMMREMYEDGDENMKRTIAKAWTESREKQQAGMME